MSSRDVQLNATSDNPQGTVRPVEPPNEGESGPHFIGQTEQLLAVEVAPPAAQGKLEANLTITSAEFPDFKLQVPLHVEPAPASSSDN